jgi:peptidoglycan hydrolase CwlO-like protein
MNPRILKRTNELINLHSKWVSEQDKEIAELESSMRNLLTDIGKLQDEVEELSEINQRLKNNKGESS